MDDQLARELKDAGFPQTDKRCSDCIKNGSSSCTVCEDVVDAVPTLSELIEACGGGFESMRRMFDGEVTLGWEAWSANLDVFRRMFHGEGATPEEAVARLWLALQKK